MEVEEDGDEIFTPIPKTCTIWRQRFPTDMPWEGRACSGRIVATGGFYKCQGCGASFGPVKSASAPSSA